MDFKTFIFYVFAVVLVYAAGRVVTARNPVHAALHLVLAFFTAAAVWMLLKAEFLSIVLVLVYIGAVMVLFLFVVMMLDINLDRLREGFWSHMPLAISVGIIIVAEMALVLKAAFSGVPESAAPPVATDISNTRELGNAMFTQYLFAFEVAALVLLVAIIAAVSITLRRRKDTKAINPAKAVAIHRKDRVRLVSMPSEKKNPEAPDAPPAPEQAQ